MTASQAKFNGPIRHEPCSLCGGPRAFMDGSALRVQRRRRGVSLRKLAAEMGLTASYLCDLELNRRHCFLAMAKRFVDALARCG